MRITRQHTMMIAAPASAVFSLLCPVREAEYIPGWQFRMIYSDSGRIEPACTFATPNDDGSETFWYTTMHDPATRRVEFVWFRPAMMIAEVKLALFSRDNGLGTAMEATYVYTALTDEGAREMDSYSDEWFRAKMEAWRTALEQAIAHSSCGQR